MVRPRVVLPQPLSPTTPSVSPAIYGQVHVVDRPDLSDHALEQPAPHPGTRS